MQTFFALHFIFTFSLPEKTFFAHFLPLKTVWNGLQKPVCFAMIKRKYL